MSSLALVTTAPAQVARATIAHHSKSFALASKLLGTRVRDQTAVIYTWCRRADDAVDDGSIIDPGAVLARLHGELDDAYAGTAHDPVLGAFGDVVRARAIPRAYPAALLAGMAMDVAPRRYATVEDVITYGWHVAGVVGLMMTHVFGVADDAALTSAAHLGIAMQLTNICRDVAEDWDRGRLYVPDDLLARRGAGGLAGELGRPFPRSAVAPVGAAVEELLALADRYYRSGDRGVSALPWRAALAVRAARNVYASIGDRIARQDHDVTAGRAFVPRGNLLAKVAAATIRTLLGTPVRAVRSLAGQRAHLPGRILELADVPRL